MRLDRNKAFEECDRLLRTLSRWNTENTSLAWGGDDTPWQAIDVACTRILALAGISTCDADRLISLYYENGEDCSYNWKYVAGN